MPVYHEERYDSAPLVTSRPQKKIRVLLGPTNSVAAQNGWRESCRIDECASHTAVAGIPEKPPRE
jgi:hypothetical protein